MTDVPRPPCDQLGYTFPVVAPMDPRTLSRRHSQDNVDLANGCMRLDSVMQEIRNYSEEIGLITIEPEKISHQLESHLHQWYRDHDKYSRYLLEASDLRVSHVATRNHEPPVYGLSDKPSYMPVSTGMSIVVAGWMSNHHRDMFVIYWDLYRGSIIGNPLSSLEW